MQPELTPTESGHYAALGPRFRALRIDLFLWLGMFVVGGVLIGIVFENSPAARTAAFVAMLIVTLGYEPFMVSRYGGTIGHQKANIRIANAQTGGNLPFWRAAVRSLLKQLLGILSFVLMFVTHRAQAIHDLVSGATVTIRDPRRAARADYFYPTEPATGEAASALRRIAMIVLYNFLLLALAVVAAGLFGSSEGVQSLLGTGWLAGAVLLIALGWTGRLPGCRNTSEAVR